MATIAKRGDGWEVRWRDPDGRSRRRATPTREAAKELCRDVERCVALGRCWKPERRGDPALVEVIRAYVTAKRRVWRPNTVENNEFALSIFAEWVPRHLRQKEPPVGVLSKKLLEEFAEHLETTRTNDQSTVANRIDSLRLFWKWAAESDDYADAVPRPKKPEVKGRQPRDTTAPTWEQMDAVLAQAPSDHWRRLLMVLRCTGLRKSQALALLWTDVDLGAGRLRVRPELGKSKQERRGRTVPLAPVLLRELRTWERSGKHLIDWPGIRKAHNIVCVRAWERAGVPRDVWEQRSLHAFRKGFVSGLRRERADPDAVERLVGHSLGTRGTYTADEALRMDEAVARVPPVSPRLVAATEAA